MKALKLILIAPATTMYLYLFKSIVFLERSCADIRNLKPSGPV